MITMQDACNPDAARQTFQIENEMAAVPFVAVPEFQRRAAGRAPIRVMVLGALGGQGLAAPDALGAGLFARLARRAGCRSNPACEPFNALRRSLPPDPAAVGAPPKGLSDDGGRDEFAEFRARRSESSTVIVCNRQRSSTRAVGSRASKNARFIAERSTGGLFDMPASESDSRRWR